MNERAELATERPVNSGQGKKYQMAALRNKARYWKADPNPLQRTPQGLFDQLDAEFHFTLDAAASVVNTKCSRFYTADDNSLHQPWAPETVWCNPPYGRGLDAWIQKAYREAGLGAIVVMLVPATTDLGWWHDFAAQADEIRFIRGRVKFERENGEVRYGTKYQNSFFPSAVLVFRPSPITDGNRAREVTE